MRILVIEDDYEYFAVLRDDLETDSELSKHSLDIMSIESEREFLDRFEEIAEGAFDFVIMDVMVKYEGREPDQRRPSHEVLKGGYYRSGFRCLEKLRQDPRTRHLRVVVHSNLDEQHMGKLREQHKNDETQFVPKSGSSADAESAKDSLLAVLHSWTAAPAPRATV